MTCISITGKKYAQKITPILQVLTPFTCLNSLYVASDLHLVKLIPLRTMKLFKLIVSPSAARWTRPCTRAKVFLFCFYYTSEAAVSCKMKMWQTYCCVIIKERAIPHTRPLQRDFVVNTLHFKFRFLKSFESVGTCYNPSSYFTFTVVIK